MTLMGCCHLRSCLRCIIVVNGNECMLGSGTVFMCGWV